MFDKLALFVSGGWLKSCSHYLSYDSEKNSAKKIQICNKYPGGILKAVQSNLDIVNKSVRPFLFTIYRIIHYIKCNMLSKSWKWELGFVQDIAKFTISMFVISRFECNHGSWYLTFIWKKKWWINNPHALALRGYCFDDFLKILFEYGYDSYLCQVLIQKSRLPLTYTSWYHNIFIAFL